MSVETMPLAPFGLEVHVPKGTRFEDLDPNQVHRWVASNRVVVFRGLAEMSKNELPRASRRLGPLQTWSFGSVHELVPDDAATNYLYTRRGVPLHWDGAFTPRVPRILFFQCVDAPADGGETLFVDTTRVWNHADDATRDRWRALRFAYETDHVVHYGGRFVARVVAQHPYTGETVLRFAEPVDDLNPVTVEAVGLSPLESASTITALRRELYADDVVLAHKWRPGDVVLADNHALLHGRRAFDASAPRHIRRINVHGPERTWRDALLDSLRIRRPEFMVAEIPILLIPALLSGAPLASRTFAAVAALFFLLFHFGDMTNCLADRDLDAVYKTHLSEAIFGLGVRNVKTQIGVTVALALAIGAWLGWDVLALTASGLLLGAQYSFRPLWLKGRGLWQILTLWTVIFFGPMVLVTRALGGRATALELVLFACYGAMQQGIILVNTAEDLPEDTAQAIRTSAVALGIRGATWLAAAMVILGGAGVLVVLASRTTRLWELVPLAIAWAWVGANILSLARRAPSLATLRREAKRVPVWIAATAWGALASFAVHK